MKGWGVRPLVCLNFEDLESVEQSDGADGGNNEVTDESITRQSDQMEQDGSDDGSYQTDDEIGDQPKATPFHNLAT